MHMSVRTSKSNDVCCFAVLVDIIFVHPILSYNVYQITRASFHCCLSTLTF